MKRNSISTPAALLLSLTTPFLTTIAPYCASVQARIGAITLEQGEDEVVSAVVDSAGAFTYFGTSSSPGVVKVDPSTCLLEDSAATKPRFCRCGVWQLPT